jgi:acyl carrier protein
MIDGGLIMNSNIESKVREILKKQVKFEKDIDQLELHDDLVAEGMNSIKFLKVVVAIEEAFDIDIDEDELNVENFRTLHNLVSTIENLSSMSVD